MAFPLFDLPDEAVELVHRCVRGPKDRRALRLVCKRSCAMVDDTILKVSQDDSEEGRKGAALSALVRARWRNLQKLYIYSSDAAGFRRVDVGALAAASWPVLQSLMLSGIGLGVAGVTALSAAHLPRLEALEISECSLDDEAVAALAATTGPNSGGFLLLARRLVMQRQRP